MKHILGTVLFLVMAVVGCKTPGTQDSALRDQAPQDQAQPLPEIGPAIDCACGDMECWRRATSDGVKDQVACAKDALEKVVPVLGPIFHLADTVAATQDGIAGLGDV